MSCDSLKRLLRNCGAKGVIGGTEKLYMLSFADANTPEGAEFGEVYTTNARGLVDDIGLATGKKFQEVGLLRSTNGITEELTKNLQTGSSFLTQTMPLVLSGMTEENRDWVNSVIDQPVIALIKTRSGRWFIVGLNGLFELATLTGGSGVAEGDLSGYTLGFNGIDNALIRGVDPTLIPEIVEVNQVPANFNTEIAFASAVTGSAAGITATVPAIDPDALFEFNFITPRVGLPKTMEIRVGSTAIMTVSFQDDYIGSYFRVTSAADVVYLGQFAEGIVTVTA